MQFKHVKIPSSPALRFMSSYSAFTPLQCLEDVTEGVVLARESARTHIEIHVIRNPELFVPEKHGVKEPMVVCDPGYRIDLVIEEQTGYNYKILHEIPYHNFDSNQQHKDHLRGDSEDDPSSRGSSIASSYLEKYFLLPEVFSDYVKGLDKPKDYEPKKENKFKKYLPDLARFGADIGITTLFS